MPNGENVNIMLESMDNIIYTLYDHMCNNTLERIWNIIDNIHVSNAFSYWNIWNFEGDKGSYDKQNLTCVVISEKNYEACQRLVS